MLKKHSWEEFFAKHSDKNAKPYEFRERYSDNAIVTHPKFGKGFVTEVVSDSKVEITFKDSRRVLVHNRKDMPGLPLAAEGDGMATNSKTAKGKAAAAAKAAKEAAAKVSSSHKESAAVAAAKNTKNRAKVPPAKTSPAAKPAAAKRTGKPAPAVRPVAATKKASAPAKAAKPAKPAKKAKAKGKK
ncbi:MAG TPA: hypothetical protein VK989_19420 [Polyangia bacterium]|nr:hypothetical protein [Polyangia bacterium]